MGKNLLLLPVGPWAAEGASHRVIDKDGSRRSDTNHDVTDRTNDESGNPLSLDRV